jgi:transcriptional regulator with PAS, ATPase and Fis domain
MQGAPVLVLSDAPAASGASGFVSVSDRERAAEYLAAGRVRAICLDRTDLAEARSDAGWLRRRRNRLPVVALVDAGQVGRAVDLLGAGVAEIVVRGDDGAASVLSRLRTLSQRGAREAGRPDGMDHIVAESPAMRACLDLVEKARRSDATVLLQGETGTGKEVLARALHAGSRRARGSFVAINCAAFPETLLESELFGHERGAFTGAERAKRGHFAEASGGSLFLDEIGETSLGFQVKLLRVLQEGTVRALGATRETRVDVRVIAATNRDLAHLVEAGQFRRDLYYRLNVFPIALPGLRARSGDIAPLAAAFLADHSAGDAPQQISADALRLLETHAWPGNVRELRNEIERVVASHPGEPEITAAMLSLEIQGIGAALPPDPGGETLRETMRRLEVWVLRRALERYRGRRVATARALGITREALYKKLKRYGMQ